LISWTGNAGLGVAKNKTGIKMRNDIQKNLKRRKDTS